MIHDVVSCRLVDFLKDVWGTNETRGLKHIPVIGVPSDLLDEAEYEEELLRGYAHVHRL